MTVKPPHHGRDHRPGGEDPIPLQAIGDAIVQLGGKMPWFESTYIISGSPHLTSGVVHTADQFGGTTPTVRTTDNVAGYTDVLSAPQVYSSGSYYSCDYSTAPEIAVNVLQAGVYHMTAEFIVNHYDVSAGSPFFAGVGMQVTTSGPTVHQYASDSRYISDTLLTDGLDGGTPPEYLGEMADGKITASKTFYIPSAATVQLFYLHTATLIGTGIRFSIFRVSDGSGNSAPGSGSGSGIVYDFANTGDWLQVGTTGTGAAVSIGTPTRSYGFLGAALTSEGNFVIATGDSGSFYVDSGFDLNLKAADAFTVRSDSIDVLSGDALLTLNSMTAAVTAGISFSPGASGNFDVGLNVGTKLRVLDSGGAPIFEVREGGSVHIKSGTSIVADL